MFEFCLGFLKKSSTFFKKSKVVKNAYALGMPMQSDNHQGKKESYDRKNSFNKISKHSAENMKLFFRKSETILVLVV